MQASSAKLRVAWSYVKLCLGFLLIGVVLLFATQNAQVATVSFLHWQTRLSQSLLVFADFALGAVAGSLFTGRLYWRGSRMGKRRQEGADTGRADTGRSRSTP
jgi:uncharacterized integral membrane protein